MCEDEAASLGNHDASMPATTSKLIMYGARWCPDVLLMRRYLNRAGVAYDYRDIDKDAGAMEELFALRGQAWVVPTLVLYDGTILDNPSRHDVKDHLGL